MTFGEGRELKGLPEELRRSSDAVLVGFAVRLVPCSGAARGFGQC